MLLVLKIIGIIILAVLIIGLGLIALVLFVPIRYNVELLFADKTEYAYKVSWLLGFVAIKKKMHEDEMKLYFSGIDVSGLKKYFKKKNKNDDFGTDEVLSEDDMTSDEVIPVEDDMTSDEVIPVEDDMSGDNGVIDENDILTDKKAEKKTQKKPGGKRKKGIFSRKKRKNKAGKDKKRFSFDKISGIITFVRDDKNKKGFKKIKDEILALIKYILPCYSRAYIRFGTGDPASTGQLLGVISLFPLVYDKNYKIVPDFEEKVLQGEAYFKGRLRIIYLVRLVIRVYFDEEMMDVINKARALEI